MASRRKRPVPETTVAVPPWQASNVTYMAGRAHIDGVDALANAMEQKWGVDRLRLLVSPELRERFDRQRSLFNDALRTGDVGAVQRECERMTRAWKALDRIARELGACDLRPEVWEFALEGKVIALVRTPAEAHLVVQEGRQVEVWTLSEVAALIKAFPEVARVKEVFPGASVTACRSPMGDPLDGGSPFNDEVAI